MRQRISVMSAMMLGVGAISCLAPPCFASPITYSEEVTASGTLNGVGFTNADVVLSMMSDTTTVETGRLNVNSGTTTATVSDGVPMTITGLIAQCCFTSFTPPIVVSGDPWIGFQVGPVVILETQPAVFPGLYDLKTSIGPLSGRAIFNAGIAHILTTGGDLILNSVSGGTSTFTASVTENPVPEPSALLLLGTGVALAGFSVLGGRKLRRLR